MNTHANEKYSKPSVQTQSSAAWKRRSSLRQLQYCWYLVGVGVRVRVRVGVGVGVRARVRAEIRARAGARVWVRALLVPAVAADELRVCAHLLVGAHPEAAQLTRASAGEAGEHEADELQRGRTDEL